MRKVVVTSLTLDGVMQAPGRPDEDFHGFWPMQTATPSPRCSTATTTGVLIATYQARRDA